MKKHLRVSAVLLSVATCGAAFAIPTSVAYASSVILDGTFQNSIGTGLNLTPWSDWTNAGVNRLAAPSGIPGNYASLPMYSDLFQRFSGPNPGAYTLSFFVQNQTPWAAELVFSFQNPGGGGGWYDFLHVLDLPASTGFTAESFTVNLTHPANTLSEFYFSNSYDGTSGYPALANSKNPAGTIINVADVSLTADAAPITAVPEPSTWAMMLIGFAGLGFAAYRRTKKRSAAIAAA